MLIGIQITILSGSRARSQKETTLAGSGEGGYSFSASFSIHWVLAMTKGGPVYTVSRNHSTITGGKMRIVELP